MMVARYYDVFGDKSRECGGQREWYWLEWSDVYVVVVVAVTSD